MIVRTESELNYVFSKLASAACYGIDTETVDRGFPDIKLTGFSIAWSGTEGAYVPTGHVDQMQLPQDLVMKRLKEFVESNYDKVAVLQNAKYDMSVLKLVGDIQFGPNIFDTMVASWLIDTENEHGLKALVRRYLNYAMTELHEITPTEKHPVTGDKVMRTDLVAIETLGKYAVDDATKPIQLMEVFLPLLEAEGLLKVFADLEMPKVHLLHECEMNGVRLDMEMLRRRMLEAPIVLADIEKKMYSLRPSKEPFNANSPKQLNEVLFDEAKIKPIGEPGKTGLYSTNKENMEKWAADSELVGTILEYRQISKLLGTYLEGLSKRVGPDGRIRTRFNPILTTGRLSSSKPNLQNIPRPDNDKFGLREMFIAGEGKKLVVADYSQVELRVLAHISKDPTFVKAFTDGEDLHSYAAKMLFDLPEPVGEVKSKHKQERSIGKTFNFAMVYGAGAQTLGKQAGVSEKQATELRDKYLKRFSGIQKYTDAVRAGAERNGYTTTLVGRRRHLPDAMLKGNGYNDKRLKSAAFRQAGNSPIQGSAADILFIGMRNINERLIREGLKDRVKFVLQVHDEVIYEVDEDIADEVARIVKEELEGAVTLRVPLIADTEIGDRWSDCK